MSDELFARPPLMKVFISSHMKGGLDSERIAAAEAVEATSFARAWYWERDSRAGPYSSEEVCLGHARTSDGLVLLLAEELRPMVRKEYRAAYDRGAPCYIMLKDLPIRPPDTEAFIGRERDGRAVTQGFGSTSELRTQVTGAIIEFAVQASRREIIRRRSEIKTSGNPLNKLRRILTRRPARS